jgi:hypothetical protein
MTTHRLITGCRLVQGSKDGAWQRLNDRTSETRKAIAPEDFEILTFASGCIERLREFNSRYKPDPLIEKIAKASPQLRAAYFAIFTVDAGGAA